MKTQNPEVTQLLIWDVDRPGHAQVELLDNTQEEFEQRLSEGKWFFSLNPGQFRLLSNLIHTGIEQRREDMQNLNWRTMSCWLELHWGTLCVLMCEKCKQRLIDYDAVRETNRLICIECNDGYNSTLKQYVAVAPDHFPQPPLEMYDQ